MRLRHELQTLAETSESLWAKYLEAGPGKLAPDLLTPLDAGLNSVRTAIADHKAGPSTIPVEAWRDELNATISTIENLLHRCVERTEGLSFVTGEAGLIPRRDLHEQCEAALTRLRELISQLPE